MSLHQVNREGHDWKLIEAWVNDRLDAKRNALETVQSDFTTNVLRGEIAALRALLDGVQQRGAAIEIERDRPYV